jgi:hypothetical protein
MLRLEQHKLMASLSKPRGGTLTSALYWIVYKTSSLGQQASRFPSVAFPAIAMITVLCDCSYSSHQLLEFTLQDRHCDMGLCGQKVDVQYHGRRPAAGLVGRVSQISSCPEACSSHSQQRTISHGRYLC